MNNKKVKFGVFGLVRGKGISACIADVDGAELTAVCDRDSQKLSEVSQWLKKEKKAEAFKCVESFDELLSCDIDAVFIANDANCHVEYVVKAMEAGKHVLSEIPAVSSEEEARVLKKAVADHPHLKYMCGENSLYWAFVQGWKSLYNEGKFGDVVFARGEYLHARYFDKQGNQNPESGHWRLAIPAIEYLTHTLGPLLYILDDRCISVTCAEPDPVAADGRTAPANGMAVFRTQKGTAINVTICFGAYVGFDHNFSLYGTKGMIETDNTKSFFDAHSFARFIDVPDTNKEKLEIPVKLEMPGFGKDGHGGADERMIKAFVECVANDTESPIDVDMAIRMSLPGIYAHLSAQNGGQVMTIPDI